MFMVLIDFQGNYKEVCMAIILNVVTDPSSGESYDVVTVKNIKQGYVVYFPTLNFSVGWGLAKDGEKFLYYNASTSIALTAGVQRLVDQGILEIVT